MNDHQDKSPDHTYIPDLPDYLLSDIQEDSATMAERNYSGEPSSERLLGADRTIPPGSSRPEASFGEHGSTQETRIEFAKRIVRNYVIAQLNKTDYPPYFDVYVVWFCKTLQNWKALISTSLPDGMYYEVTYDGDKERVYVDAYKKFQNIEFRADDM